MKALAHTLPGSLVDLPHVSVVKVPLARKNVVSEWCLALYLHVVAATVKYIHIYAQTFLTIMTVLVQSLE